MTAAPAAAASAAGTATPALEIRDLVVRYGSGRKAKRATPAIDGVSFDIAPGETVGLVGRIRFRQVDDRQGGARAAAADGRHRQAARQGHHPDVAEGSGAPLAADLRVVFQDPYSSLNPSRTIGQTLVEPLRLMGIGNADAMTRARKGLESVGLPAEAIDRYPSQFSGGQRQRIAIARALVCDPKVVVLDEPVSALDLSTQATVLNLLADLRDQMGLAFLFIAHDLGVVRFLAQRTVVLYRGQIMESGPVESVNSQSRHPYTVALTAAAPVPRPAEQAARREAREALGVGSAGAAKPSPVGCPFVPRCPLATEICSAERPPLRLVDGNLTACHHAEQVPELASALLS